MKRLTIVLSVLLFIGCAQEEASSSNPVEKEKTSETTTKKNIWSSRAIPIDDLGWGYQLFEGATLRISQKNIPAISGLHYFETKEKAEMAAALALEKIDQGFFPPSVDPEELDSIGAINLDSLLQLNEAMKNGNPTK